MAAKKLRTPVVLDTNIFVRAFKSKHGSSPNKRVIRCWLVEKRLLPSVCEEIVEEYLEIFESVLGLEGYPGGLGGTLWRCNSSAKRQTWPAFHAES